MLYLFDFFGIILPDILVKSVTFDKLFFGKKGEEEKIYFKIYIYV